MFAPTEAEAAGFGGSAIGAELGPEQAANGRAAAVAASAAIRRRMTKLLAGDGSVRWLDQPYDDRNGEQRVNLLRQSSR